MASGLLRFARNDDSIWPHHALDQKSEAGSKRLPGEEDILALAESYVAGPTTPAVRDMTFGDLLRQAAEVAPDRLALIAGVPDPSLRRQWTYAELYREAQRTEIGRA